ncbi:MAG: regulatory protein GemA, partial [Candidatus Methylomirabilis sp.]|nr:regulatory protein GemA [Deltaproteobacteria bacterium]
MKDRRAREIATIHLGAKSLGMDDDARRDLMERVGGARSAALLTDAGRSAVIEEMRRLGFKPAAKFRKSDNPQVRLLYALAGDLERAGALRIPRKEFLAAFCKRQTGVESPEWMTPE